MTGQGNFVIDGSTAEMTGHSVEQSARRTALNDVRNSVRQELNGLLRERDKGGAGSAAGTWRAAQIATLRSVLATIGELL